jgi:LysR family transcriptional regulator, nitrogen assimilation regulatory protein
MELRRLRYFLGIVEQGSLSGAAQALGVAQPALSLHLRRLETDLGCTLMVRTSRGVIPTESGLLLAERARNLLEQAEGLRDEIRGRQAEPKGNVAVGIPTTLGAALTVPLVRDIRSRFPGIRLRVAEALSGHMLEWTLSGQVDMALVFGAEDAPGLILEPVARDCLALLGPKDHPIMAGAGHVQFAQVLDLPLILPGRPHGVREEVEKSAASAGRSPNVLVEIDALPQIIALVGEGLGFTVLSRRFAAQLGPGAGIAFHTIAVPEITRTISLAHALRRPLGLAAEAVHRVLSDLIADLVKRGVWE